MEISIHKWIKRVYNLIGTEYYNLTYHVYTKYISVWLRNSMTCSVYINRWSSITCTNIGKNAQLSTLDHIILYIYNVDVYRGIYMYKENVYRE